MKTMHNILRYGLIGGLMLLFAVPVPSYGRRDRFAEVEPAQLRDNPHRYWSRGVIFQDTLTHHPRGRTVRLNDRRFNRVTTKIAGDAYVDRDDAERFENLELGRDYIFTGMVLSRTGRDFLMRQRRTEYFITLAEAVPVARDVEQALEHIMRPEDEMPGITLDSLMTLLNQVQRRLMAHAEEQNLDMTELFDPEHTERSDRALELVRASVRTFERDAETTSFIVLSDILYALLAMEYRKTPAPGIEPGDEEEETPEPAPAIPEDVDETEEQPDRIGDEEIGEPVEQEPEIIEEDDTPDPGSRRRFFSRRARVAVEDNDEVEPQAPEDEQEPEPVEPAPLVPETGIEMEREYDEEKVDIDEGPAIDATRDETEPSATNYLRPIRRH